MNVPVSAPVEVVVRPRRRTLAITISEDGKVRVLAPPKTAAATIREFVVRKRHWIEDKLAEIRSLESPWRECGFAAGDTLPFRGGELVLHVVQGRGGTVLAGPRLLVRTDRTPGTAEAREDVRRRVVAWCRKRAGIFLPERTEHLASELGFKPAAVSVRDYKRRWGSCFRSGLIALNWRLILMPPEIADYVMVHELCHLQHHDHSPHYYRLLASHWPAWRRHRQWLHDHGRFLPV